MEEQLFSQSSLNTAPSFIRAILKATEKEEVISFAGGLPNPVSFPQEALKESSRRVISEFGSKLFQYAPTNGLLQLREFIADRLKKIYQINCLAEDIIVTTGAQQAIDLVGKVFINAGDRVIMEEPSYLGAIQTFSQYLPEFVPIPLSEDGIDLEELEKSLQKEHIKFAYLIPNYQNPSGLTYSMEIRDKVLELLKKYHCLLVEDNPYGELCFDGNPQGYIGKDNMENSILLGSFSKIITPGMRLGYMVIKNPDIRQRMNTAKEASDLHSNIFCQYVIWDYLMHHDLDAHIRKIRTLYQSQCETMIQAMETYFPKNISFTRPTGGMFVWVTVPDCESTLTLYEEAIKENVAFVPGMPFYTDNRNANTMRINFTNSSEETIVEGIRRLANLLKKENGKR